MEEMIARGYMMWIIQWVIYEEKEGGASGVDIWNVLYRRGHMELGGGVCSIKKRLRNVPIKKNMSFPLFSGS